MYNALTRENGHQFNQTKVLEHCYSSYLKKHISKLINLKTSIFATNQTLTLNGTQIIDYYNRWEI